jgi:predicted GIY-YIG superfamily endonuclease
MMLRDRLAARMADMGAHVDYERLAADVIGIRGASPALARSLVEQALVMEDRRQSWSAVGRRIAAGAPSSPGVYVLRDAANVTLYVGKAVNVRRRLQRHFAATRWNSLKPAMARVAAVEWHIVGSELEALLREAQLIRRLRPVVNVQVGRPVLARRAIPAPLVRDVIAILPSSELHEAELVAARTDGGVSMQRTARSGVELPRHAEAMWTFFDRAARQPAAAGDGGDAAIVFSWLSGRGASTTRLDPHQWGSEPELRSRLSALLKDDQLFLQRLAVV